MNSDPLSSILALFEVNTTFVGGFVVGGDWAIEFPPPDRIKFFAIVRGQCLITHPDRGAPFWLGPGDVVLMRPPHGYVLARREGLKARPVAEVLDTFCDDEATLLTNRGGDDFFLLAGHADFSSLGGRLVAEHLPALLHLPAGTPEAADLQWFIDKLAREQVGGRPGASFAAAQLTQLMFLCILRGHLARPEASMPGWLAAAADRRLGPVLQRIHADPAREWSLGELAQGAAMSRTVFAQQFKAITGIAPMAYVTQWRMHLAAKRLREGAEPVSAIARTLGYGSDTAFGQAFRRLFGQSPKQYRLAARRGEA